MIGAPGITLDMGGHTASAARGNRAHGILNVGHDDVTIRNGTVRGFGLYGVRLCDRRRNVVEAMRLTRNLTGIGLVDSTDGTSRAASATGSRSSTARRS